MRILLGESVFQFYWSISHGCKYEGAINASDRRGGKGVWPWDLLLSESLLRKHPPKKPQVDVHLSAADCNSIHGQC